MRGAIQQEHHWSKQIEFIQNQNAKISKKVRQNTLLRIILTVFLPLSTELQGY